ncbi:hypothetical protein [Natronoglomus mannanivorans]|uniref:Uncharacterized protein n=1 Tax=Natronoglomus mannanivorans TaxID=2979990 RepID=A0AAP3E4S8_9EURY|nr:hypothetical protein [Halobacteria archaeon AArc-xg1-1]
MSTDTNDETEEFTVRPDSPTGVARCEEDLEEDSAPYTVHGIAIAGNEVTYGQGGPKYWPASELKDSVSSLVGVPLNKNHVDNDVDAVIGEVVDVAYDEGVGVVFEAEVDDEEIATKIARGRLEVSIHAVHRSDGMTDEGAKIVKDVRFLDLSVVPRGGSPSNYVEAGSSPSEAIASLTANDMAQLMQNSESDHREENMTEDTDETTEEVESELEESEVSTDADEDVQEEAEAAEADAEPEDVEEEAEVEVDDEPAQDEAELREQIEELEAENEELRSEVESVRLEYAGRLAEDTEFFEAEELAEKYKFDELKEKFDEAEASIVPEAPGQEESTPAPQTGDAEESELSTSDDSESDAEIAELESKIEKYDTMGWDAAKADAEANLAQLRE